MTDSFVGSGVSEKEAVGRGGGETGSEALHGWQQLRKFAQRRRQQVRAHFNSQQ